MIHENLVRLHVFLGFPSEGIKVNGVCLYKPVYSNPNRQDLPFVCLSLCISKQSDSTLWCKAFALRKN